MVYIPMHIVVRSNYFREHIMFSYIDILADVSASLLCIQLYLEFLNGSITQLASIRLLPFNSGTV